MRHPVAGQRDSFVPQTAAAALRDGSVAVLQEPCPPSDTLEGGAHKRSAVGGMSAKREVLCSPPPAGAAATAKRGYKKLPPENWRQL